jgi:hypothetical protein
MEDNDLIENDGSSDSCTWCGRSNGDGARTDREVVSRLHQHHHNARALPTFKVQAVGVRGPIRLAGLSLAITNVARPRAMIFMEAAYRCWIRIVTSLFPAPAYLVEQPFRPNWDSSFHHGNGADWSSPTGGSRVLHFHDPGHHGLPCENNDFGIPLPWPSKRRLLNVIAYNFVTNIVVNRERHPSLPWAITAHPIMNL